MSDPLAFGIDLESVRQRVLALNYFTSVTDVLDASEALDGLLAGLPPAAFVGVANERAAPNKIIGGHSQRTSVEVAVLFAESAARADRRSHDQLERTRKAVIRQLVAWQPAGGERGLNYVRYRVVSIGDGLAWGEATFETTYLLSTLP